MGVRGVYRVLRSAIEDGFGSDGIYRMGNPGQGDLSYLPKATREYSALEFTLEKYSEGVKEIASKNEGYFADQFHPFVALKIGRAHV